MSRARMALVPLLLLVFLGAPVLAKQPAAGNGSGKEAPAAKEAEKDPLGRDTPQAWFPG